MAKPGDVKMTDKELVRQLFSKAVRKKLKQVLIAAQAKRPNRRPKKR